MMRALLFCCVVGFFWSCDDDGPEAKKLSGSYLPLEVGNYWDFSGVNAATDDIAIHREVKGIATLNGHEYYLVISGMPSNKSILDSAYYRVDDQQNVYTYRRSMGIEELKYKLK